MKKSLFALFAVLVLLASAVPASAQYLPTGYIPQSIDGLMYHLEGDRVMMLTSDNLALVRNLNRQLRREQIRNVVDDFDWNPGMGAYGINTARGFYPMYDQNMRPMSHRERAIIGAGIGAAAGYAILGTGRGAVAGAGIGAVVGILTHPRDRRNEVVTMGQSQAQMSAGQKPEYPEKQPWPAEKNETYQQMPSPVLVPQRVFSEEDLRNKALAKQFYGECLTREFLVDQLALNGLKMRDIVSVSRGSTYINMWNSELILTAKDGSLDQCPVPPGEERIFILPAGNMGVNALVRLQRNGQMLPITGDHMEWKSLGGSEGWIIGPKCEGAPCRQ